jgi:uncharacterized membrane-anchored protein
LLNIMQLKSAPAVEARYWTAMLVASMCGTNFGDIFSDVLHFNLLEGLLTLAAMFVAAAFIDRSHTRGFEAIYWVLVLAVRGAATLVADFSIKELNLSYLQAILIFAAMWVALVVWYRRAVQPPIVVIRPTGQYWVTMFAAGILGTLVGDGVGHSFGPLSTGYPIAAVLATVALIFTRVTWSRLFARSVIGYWLAIVLVRWWGTNWGDICAFLSSLQISLVGTAAVLGLILGLWRPSRVVDSTSDNLRQPTQMP